jgi:signal transduction histidine kinase
MAFSNLFPRHWSVKTKSLTTVISYIVTLCVVYSGFSMYLVARAEKEAKAQFQQTVETIAAKLDAHLSTGRKQLVAMSKLPDLFRSARTIVETQAISSTSTWHTIEYGFLQSPIFTGGFFLLDHNGAVTWTEPARLPWLGRTLIDAASVARLHTGEHEVVSAGIRANPFFEKPHVVVSVPIYKGTGEIRGVLGGVIDLDGEEIRGFLNGTLLDDARFIDVRDNQGCILASNHSERLLQCVVTVLDPEEVLSSTASLSQAPWQVVSEQPRSVALADVRRMHHLLWWAGLGMVLLAGNLGARFVDNFVGGIHDLTAHAKRMANGDLSQPVVLEKREDELAILADAFERMRVELGRSRSMLEQRIEEQAAFIRLKEEFLANVSHELRTPLHVIMGYTELLAEKEVDDLKRTMLGHVKTKSDQLFHLLSDLMTLAGISSGKTILQIDMVRVPYLFETLAVLAERLRQEKEIAVIWDAPATLPEIETDTLRLEQILTNLLTNAFKFTTRGQIVVRVRHASAQDVIVFEIVDTGIGIPSDKLPFIFDEFHQVDGSVNRKHGGMGLGLAIVKKLVQLLHGTVTVSSELEKGSTFTVTLPVRFPHSPSRVRMGVSIPSGTVA